MKEYILAQIEQAKKEKEILIANINATDGAIQAFESILQKINEDEKQINKDDRN
jgi:hypothetical protein